MKEEILEQIIGDSHRGLRTHTTGLLQGIAYNNMHSNLTKVLAPFGISIPEWKLLGQLQDNGKLRLAELALLLNYDPPMVTKLAKQLEKKKLLTREYDKNDERAKIISLTQKGTDTLNSIEPEIRKSLGMMLQGVTPDELQIYIRVLAKIAKNTRS